VVGNKPHQKAPYASIPLEHDHSSEKGGSIKGIESGADHVSKADFIGAGLAGLLTGDALNPPNETIGAWGLRRLGKYRVTRFVYDVAELVSNYKGELTRVALYQTHQRYVQDDNVALDVGECVNCRAGSNLPLESR
jgi:hypothetical protein